MNNVIEKKQALLKWLDRDINELDSLEIDNECDKDLQNCFFIDTNGEAYVVVSKQDLPHYIKDYILEHQEHYSYSFEDISKVLEIDVEKIKEYFIANILSDDNVVEKILNNYFVTISNVKGLMENEMTTDQFIEKYITSLSEYELNNIVLNNDNGIMDGFHIYFLG